jgi:DNA-binding NarL/FixJ family response regulator
VCPTCAALGGAAGASSRQPRHEIEALALIADGDTNRQIASDVCTSNQTARADVFHIVSKFSVQNCTAAAATARRLGLGRGS